MYRITNQRGSWCSTEIITALPVADVKKSPVILRGVFGIFLSISVFSVFVQQFLAEPPKIFCEGTLGYVQYVLNANSVLDD
jgi:hypothetical protein